MGVLLLDASSPPLCYFLDVFILIISRLSILMENGQLMPHALLPVL